MIVAFANQADFQISVVHEGRDLVVVLVLRLSENSLYLRVRGIEIQPEFAVQCKLHNLFG